MIPYPPKNLGSYGTAKKIVMTMKIITILMTVFLLRANAAVYGQISLDEKKAPLAKIFAQIKKQAGIDFFYNNSSLENAKPVNIKCTDASLKEVLDKCFANQLLTYKIQDNTVVIGEVAQKPQVTAQKKPTEALIVIKITGKVKDTAGVALPSVSVKNKNTGKIAATDANGNFEIAANVGDVLVFSYIGFAKQEVEVKSEALLNIVLREEKNNLDQVVVTALGIKKSTRALSYNVQEIKGEELTRNKDASFVNSLVGKVAGVTINASSSGIGGATRVIMRGTKSINSNNNALYVIDGVPLSNNSAGQLSGLFGGNTSSDVISSINPDDIESISTLTGAAAAALYGSLGQNGVIIITTKSGKSGKASLTISNNTSFFNPLVMPQFQNTYGSDGSYASWGEKLSTPSDYKPKDFFQTGANITNAFNFSTGTEKNQTFVSGAMVSGRGIIPNNKLTRYNFTTRNTSKFLADKLTLNLDLMYIRQKEQNMFAQGLYNSPIVPIYLFSPGNNIKTIQTYERYDATRLFPTQYWPFSDDQFHMQNPYWITNREYVINDINRFMLGANLKYNIFKWLSIAGRAKLERNSTIYTSKLYASTLQLFAGPGGRYGTTESIIEQKYYDFIASANKSFGDFNLTGNVGFSRTEGLKQTLGIQDSFIPLGAVPNLFTDGNLVGGGSGIAPAPTRTSFQGLFGNAELSYKNMVFLNFSERSDWWSQLYGTNHLNISYPSVGASVILSELLKIKSDALSFAKIRATYAIVGNPPDAFLSGERTYTVSNGQLTSGADVSPSRDLQPERTKAWETGLNLKFLKNKINLDVTLYNTNTYNQIFNVPSSITTGYPSYYFNAGKVNNKGIEASLGFNSKTGSLGWESNVTFTLNKNKLIELVKNHYDAASGQTTTVDTIAKDGAGSYNMKLTVGGTLGDIYTSTLMLDDHGYAILSPGVSANPNNFIYAGSANPDYTIGFRNNFTYKNFNLNFVLYGRFGGVGVSATQAMMDAYGVSKVTADVRDKGSIMLNGASYTDIQSYYTAMGSGLNGILSQYVYSATNVRLRELALGYTLPSKWFHDKLQSFNISLTGQNLFMFYNKAPFDPESTASTGTYYQGIDYFIQPSLRSFGFSVKVQF